ncbi:MAG: 1-acyl-sn-glycerol-3-phosphate acyltransferase [Candidatus Omnitrophica bacterium]|nr:1-acyl-sn-glycerol-3-phosphate acyltransferase [Candidatus Omnitrophota bacterium]
MRDQTTSGGQRYRGVRWTLRQLGFGFFRLRVHGLEEIPGRGGVILAGNHPSVLDGILLLILSPRPVRFLVAEELFNHPLLRWIFEGMGCIPVYRTNTRNGDALRAAVEALQRGEAIGIFPEGTTSDRGAMRVVRRGVGLLALKTGAPVVPFGVAGSEDAYPADARVPRPGRVTLVFAPAVTYGRSGDAFIPPAILRPVLEDVRWNIRRAMTWAHETHAAPLLLWRWKWCEVALSAFIVLPLSALLSLTSNPSLEPAAEAPRV